MEQRISFCTTSDGVSIAYATVGDGPPLVYATGWPGHLSSEWDTPHSRALIEGLAQGVTLIRYDMRGSGLSDREPGELSFENWVIDLEGVVDHLKLESFALLGLGFLAGPICIAYSAAHPERVSHLIMSDGYMRGEELMTPERGKTMVDFISLYGFPLSAGSGDQGLEELQARQDISKIQNQAASLEVQAELARNMLSVDVSGLVDKISIPTLIMHGREDQIVPFRLGRDLAAALPQANFVSFDESVAVPWLQQERITRELRRFLGVEVEVKPKPAPVPTADVYTILFTDMQSSTSITERLGDAGAQEVRRAHNEIVRAALKEDGGIEIKHTGDGIMASFATASAALDSAIAIQRGVASHKEAHPDSPLAVYIGLNAGEPIAEDDDLYGTSVNLAARICDRAEPGQILAADVVRQLSAGKQFLFADLGGTELRGFEDPVRLYEVRWREEG